MQEQKIYISNRGNLSGKDPDEENKPDYINKALEYGVCVKTDIWAIKNKTVQEQNIHLLALIWNYLIQKNCLYKQEIQQHSYFF